MKLKETQFLHAYMLFFVCKMNLFLWMFLMESRLAGASAIRVWTLNWHRRQIHNTLHRTCLSYPDCDDSECHKGEGPRDLL